MGDSDFHITDEHIPSIIRQLSKLNNKDSIIRTLEQLSDNNIDNLCESFLLGLETLKKKRAIIQFEKNLNNEVAEFEWQKWFNGNHWALGSEFIKILNERAIDTKNIADYLMKAYDGFLDVVEIKKPEKNLLFWASNEDHNNLIPSTQLVKAITQVTKYIYELEREANSAKFLEKIKGVRIIKPRGVLIFGRSKKLARKTM